MLKLNVLHRRRGDCPFPCPLTVSCRSTTNLPSQSRFRCHTTSGLHLPMDRAASLRPAVFSPFWFFETTPSSSPSSHIPTAVMLRPTKDWARKPHFIGLLQFSLLPLRGCSGPLQTGPRKGALQCTKAQMSAQRGIIHGRACIPVALGSYTMMALFFWIFFFE